jgi:hypothetical protein
MAGQSVIPERSFTDRSQIFAVRQEIMGWALLLLAGTLWVMRNFLPELAATQVNASAVLTIEQGGTAAQLQQAFAVARKRGAMEARLTAETNPAVHGIYYVIVTADTVDQAQAGLTALTKAIEAAVPEAERKFRVLSGEHTYPAMNETVRRLGMAARIVAVLLAVAAETLVVLGAYRQIGTLRADLYVKLAMPFLFLLLTSTGSNDKYSDPGSESSHFLWEIDPSLIPMLLATSIVPTLLIVWLTRKSKAQHSRRTTPRRSI